jgi:hypothetical protein
MNKQEILVSDVAVEKSPNGFNDSKEFHSVETAMSEENLSNKTNREELFSRIELVTAEFHQMVTEVSHLIVIPNLEEFGLTLHRRTLKSLADQLSSQASQDGLAGSLKALDQADLAQRRREGWKNIVGWLSKIINDLEKIKINFELKD